MLRIRFMAGMLLLSLAAGCKAQPTPAVDANLSRHIEVMVRSQFNVPQDYTVTLGQRKPSDVPGYDSLPVVLSRGPRTHTVDFLIAKDNSKLARLETFDLSKDPVFHIDTTGRPIRGNPNAKVTIINFDDLECPYCARMHQSLFPTTLDRYKDKVRFIYKDDPLVEIHPWAMRAAVDANCLAAQNGEAYWNFVDYLHSHGQEVNGQDRNLAKSNDALDRIAREQGAQAKVDSAKLDACLAKQDESQVRASSQEAEKLGVNGTPALFIDGERIEGAVPETALWMVIDRALRAAGEEPPADQPAPAANQQKPSGQ